MNFFLLVSFNAHLYDVFSMTIEILAIISTIISGFLFLMDIRTENVTTN